jgi:hypothetical protein
MSSGTFAAFSKFHLNTSNSPNVKVVYFVEEHNFHVEWHLKFGVEMREKAWSTPKVTVHRRPENNQLGMQFVHNWLRKRPYALCKSRRGMLDLQLSYSNLCALQIKFLEKNPGQSMQAELVLTLALQSGVHAGIRASTAPRPHWARTPRPASIHRSLRHGPTPTCAAPPSSPTPLAPRTARLVAESADLAAAGHWGRCRTQRTHRRCTTPML